MRTQRYTLVLALLSLTFTKAQDFQIPWQITEQKQGVSVTVVNKVGEDPVFQKKQELLEKAFKEAADAYIKALTSADHPINKAIGPFRRPTALRILSGMEITVMMLEKDDPQDHPMTWRLPTMFQGGDAFVTKIPYKFLENGKVYIRFEHLALHEIAHIVAGTLDKTLDSEDLSELEIQRRVEYLVYLMVGEKKYKEFIYQLYVDEHPKASDQSAKLTVEKWMKLMGVEKDPFQLDIGG